MGTEGLGDQGNKGIPEDFLAGWAQFPGLNHPSDEDLSPFPTNEDLFAGAPVPGTPVRIETWGTQFVVTDDAKERRRIRT